MDSSSDVKEHMSQCQFFSLFSFKNPQISHQDFDTVSSMTERALGLRSIAGSTQYSLTY